MLRYARWESLHEIPLCTFLRTARLLGKLEYIFVTINICIHYMLVQNQHPHNIHVHHHHDQNIQVEVFNIQYILVHNKTYTLHTANV